MVDPRSPRGARGRIRTYSDRAGASAPSPPAHRGTASLPPSATAPSLALAIALGAPVGGRGRADRRRRRDIGRRCVCRRAARAARAAGALLLLAAALWHGVGRRSGADGAGAWPRERSIALAPVAGGAAGRSRSAPRRRSSAGTWPAAPTPAATEPVAAVGRGQLRVAAPVVTDNRGRCAAGWWRRSATRPARCPTARPHLCARPAVADGARRGGGRRAGRYIWTPLLRRRCSSGARSGWRGARRRRSWPWARRCSWPPARRCSLPRCRR